MVIIIITINIQRNSFKITKNFKILSFKAIDFMIFLIFLAIKRYLKIRFLKRNNLKLIKLINQSLCNRLFFYFYFCCFSNRNKILLPKWKIQTKKNNFVLSNLIIYSSNAKKKIQQLDTTNFNSLRIFIDPLIFNQKKNL